MQKKRSEVDVIGKLLDACYEARPDALFFMSLMHQYEERGSLSKKQLEGLYQKAIRIDTIPENWLATLQATILKMPTRYKAAANEITIKPADTTGELEELQQTIQAILTKYPEHKRILFLKARLENNRELLPAEKAELEKFKKLLLK
jgi:hypothetical protein